MSEKQKIMRSILEAEPKRVQHYNRLRKNPGQMAQSVFGESKIIKALATGTRNAVIRKRIFDTPAVPTLLTQQRNRSALPTETQTYQSALSPTPKLNLKRARKSGNKGGPTQS